MNGVYRIKGDKHYLMTSDEIIDITDKVENVDIIESDIIELTDKINLVQNTKLPIPGILHISSKTSYGITDKGYMIKKFTPFNKNLPDFLVSTRKPYQSTDIYAVIKFDKIKNRVCYGTIENYIGDIGEIESEKNYIQICATILYSNIKKMDFKEYFVDRITDRLEIKGINIYSIDPEGCIDIDDALHIKVFDDYYEVGIHIADVSAYIPYNSPLDIELLNRSESIYLKDNQINMLPEQLCNICSLFSNVPKKSFSIITKIDLDGNMIDYKLVHTTIIVTENLSYDNAQYLIDNNKNYDLINLMKVSQLINKTLENDTHKMVEVYMILANKIAAIELYKKHKDNAIIRKHHIEHKIIHTKFPKKISEKINIYNYEAATYSYAIGDFKHDGIDEKYYTHFTSPIRRYFDIMVHRMLCSDTVTLKPPMMYIINENHKRIKLCQNKDTLFDKIMDVPDKIYKTEGIVIGIKEKFLRLYVEEFDIDSDINMVPKTLNHLIEIGKEGDDIYIKSKQNYRSIRLTIGEKIGIILAITLKDVTKFRVKITSPNVEELFESNKDVMFEED